MSIFVFSYVISVFVSLNLTFELVSTCFFSTEIIMADENNEMRDELVSLAFIFVVYKGPFYCRNLITFDGYGLFFVAFFYISLHLLIQRKRRRRKKFFRILLRAQQGHLWKKLIQCQVTLKILCVV